MNWRRPRWLAFAVASAIVFSSPSASAQDPATPFDTTEPIEILADALEVNQDEQLAVFAGNVTATQGRILLSADQVVVHYATGGNGGTQAISTIDAKGNVFFSTGLETAQGDNGTYDVENGIVTLTGAVVLTQGDNVVRGQRLVLNLVDGTTKVEGGAEDEGGRIRGLFVPIKPAN